MLRRISRQRRLREMQLVRKVFATLGEPGSSLPEEDLDLAFRAAWQTLEQVEPRPAEQVVAAFGQWYFGDDPTVELLHLDLADEAGGVLGASQALSESLSGLDAPARVLICVTGLSLGPGQGDGPGTKREGRRQARAYLEELTGRISLQRGLNTTLFIF